MGQSLFCMPDAPPPGASYPWTLEFSHSGLLAGLGTLLLNSLGGSWSEVGKLDLAFDTKALRGPCLRPGTFLLELALAMVHDLLGQKAVVDHVALTHEGEAAVLQYDIFLFWLQAAPQEFTYLPDGSCHLLCGIMAALRPLVKPKIVKKRTKKFIQHQADGYRQGVGGAADVHKSYCAVTAHNVSSKNRKAIVERAAQLAIGVTNPNARLRGEENESRRSLTKKEAEMVLQSQRHVAGTQEEQGDLRGGWNKTQSCPPALTEPPQSPRPTCALKKLIHKVFEGAGGALLFTLSGSRHLMATITLQGKWSLPIKVPPISRSPGPVSARPTGVSSATPATKGENLYVFREESPLRPLCLHGTASLLTSFGTEGNLNTSIGFCGCGFDNWELR
ncbi:hypothetical protein U0070_027520 [Myodes glareolus]|uniref:60S ribosomal protein L32 n=1 Tax=Myodes glareolus TaxID=447135 RepID=A0AAW0HG73_MYOGA